MMHWQMDLYLLSDVIDNAEWLKGINYETGEFDADQLIWDELQIAKLKYKLWLREEQLGLHQLKEEPY